MKRFLIVFIASVIYAGFASAQERSGKVTDNNGRPVEFATVALLTEDGQAAVTVTDTLGRFSPASCLSAVGAEYLSFGRGIEGRRFLPEGARDEPERSNRYGFSDHTRGRPLRDEDEQYAADPE